MYAKVKFETHNNIAELYEAYVAAREALINALHVQERFVIEEAVPEDKSFSKEEA